MQAVSSDHRDDDEADLADLYPLSGGAVLRLPFTYPCEGWRCLAFNTGVTVLGFIGVLFVLATCI
jgi:hypothetical protein